MSIDKKYRWRESDYIPNITRRVKIMRRRHIGLPKAFVSALVSWGDINNRQNDANNVANNVHNNPNLRGPFVSAFDT